MTTVTVRMYNVGFGDAFVVTVRRGRKHWRMLVDCGVHSQGRKRPIDDVVHAIVTDLEAEDASDVHFDVVVATHHHADHISGFACNEWKQVSVGEVWVPFVEDPHDPDAKSLRDAHKVVADKLLRMVEHRIDALAADEPPPGLAMAQSFAMNAVGNAAAMDRLLGGDFATKPSVRYLPSKVAAENVIETPIEGVVVHVLGPPRDKEHLKRMNPPSNVAWLRLDDGEVTDPNDLPALFDEAYQRPKDTIAADMVTAAKELDLDHVGYDEGLLAAASVLESAVNNTSVFLVLDVRGTRLLFPGDAQQGAWEHVLEDESSLALVRDVAFYKIGHHGSHNATPKRYVEEVLQNGAAQAMLPWGLVKAWEKTIPKKELLKALEDRGFHVTRANAPEEVEGVVTVHDDMWSEVTLTVR